MGRSSPWATSYVEQLKDIANHKKVNKIFYNVKQFPVVQRIFACVFCFIFVNCTIVTWKRKSELDNNSNPVSDQPKSKSIVALNSEAEAFELFKQELSKGLLEVRGLKVSFDFGDFSYLQKKTDGGVRLKRMRYIKETLCNPEGIHESVSESRKEKSVTEVYINTCFTESGEAEGEACKVVVEPIIDFSTFQRVYKFKTFYLPNDETLIQNKRGKKLWPEN
jgi:hypothetical protein